MYVLVYMCILYMCNMYIYIYIYTYIYIYRHTYTCIVYVHYMYNISLSLYIYIYTQINMDSLSREIGGKLWRAAAGKRRRGSYAML